MRAVLSLDPSNETARRYLQEVPLLRDAETAFREDRLEDSLELSRKLLAASPNHVQAAALEDRILQKLAPARIKAEVEGFAQALKSGTLLGFYERACHPSLFQRIRREVELIDSLYENCEAQVSSVSIRFPEKNKAEVRFANITTGLMKPDKTRRIVFEGTYIWIMERRGDAWLIVNIQPVPSRK